MTGTADVVIAGGGIIGLNIALQLARRLPLRIVVLDKGRGPGEGSTGASSAVCRFKYSRPEMVRLAANGVGAYRNWADYTRLPEVRAAYQPHGVLWLTADDSDAVETEAARLSALGIRVALLCDDDLQKRFPALQPCLLSPDLVSGDPHICMGGGRHLFELDAGYIDPVDALQDLIDACRQAGVVISFNSKVSGIDIAQGRMQAVRLADGSEIACPTLVNAAGPWCNEIAQLAGLARDWPLEPTRIQVVHIGRPAEVAGDIPITCDVPGGIYFRTQNRGQQLIVGSILEEDEQESVRDPDDFLRYVDDDYARAKLHALQHRIPALSCHRVQGYSGLYTINRQDVHPIVGESEIAGLFLANGFSGHGFKLAPAIGALLAHAITGHRAEGDPDVGPRFLAPDRAPIELGSLSVLA